jgi:hypothetical protein
MLDSVRSRCMEESRAEGIRSLLTIPIDSLLALDTTSRPWHGRKAFWADVRFAFQACSKVAFLNPAQRVFYVTQQIGLAVDVANRQISFRGELNLIHLVRALLDCDSVPLSQYLNQLGLFSFEDLLEPVCLAVCCLHGHPFSPYGRSIAVCTGWSIVEPLPLEA